MRFSLLYIFFGYNLLLQTSISNFHWGCRLWMNVQVSSSSNGFHHTISKDHNPDAPFRQIGGECLWSLENFSPTLEGQCILIFWFRIQFYLLPIRHELVTIEYWGFRLCVKVRLFVQWCCKIEIIIYCINERALLNI